MRQPSWVYSLWILSLQQWCYFFRSPLYLVVYLLLLNLMKFLLLTKKKKKDRISLCDHWILHCHIWWLQMEDLDHSFQSNLIQWMELTLLKTLGWRLGSVTAHSYIELLMSNFIDTLSSFLLGELTTKVSELLLGALSGKKASIYYHIPYRTLLLEPCI